MPDIVLSCSNVSKSFGKTLALNSVSLAVLKGEILGLLGPNGTGKTTLVKILSGLWLPDSGSISYFGRQVKPSLPMVKKMIAVVPQEPSFYRTFTVKQNVCFFASLYGLNSRQANERADTLINWLQLDKFSGRRAEFLSGGFQRLLNIACSLVNDPQVVFLDEPTVGLDPKMRQLLWDKINSLKDRGKAILLTTHYMDEAEKLCDRVALMTNGAISLIDSPRQLIEEYGGETILVFKLDKSVDADLTAKIEAAMPGAIVRSVQSSLVLPVKQSEATKAIVKISGILTAAGYEVKGSLVREPELEDVFLNITGRAMVE
ncbi:MAG: ABC transporter ATP-binding protein [Candidatus Diapherotrites archaeon]|nr:ABC transporter ATP-binding protein [Candidatus Diapherotrites archaeon]